MKNCEYAIAIIGCGRISGKHLEAIANNNDKARLVAVSDLVGEKMTKAVSEYRDYLDEQDEVDVTKYRRYEDLLEEEEIDIVTVATESGYHAEITKDALKAGKHVVVEKPMALSLQEADRMIELASKEDRKLSVCHQNRFNPTVLKLREAVDGGRFGKLVHGVASIRWNRDDDYYNMDDWHGTRALDGGILMNQGIHNIDLLRWMMGDVKRVSAETDTFLRDIEAEDVGLGLVRFQNGALGLIEGSVCIYPQNLEETFSIFGERGTVRIAGIAMNKIIDWTFADAPDEEEGTVKKVNYETKTVYGYGHNLLYDDVIGSIEDGRTPVVDGVEGRKAIELVLGIYKSSRRGEIIDFPIKNYSTTQDVE